MEDKLINIQNIDLKFYLDIITKRKKIFIFCFLAIFCLTSAYFLTKPFIYRTVYKMQVDVGYQTPLVDLYKETQWLFAFTQIELLKSDVLKERVSKKITDWKERLPKKYWQPRITIDRLGVTNILQVSVDSPIKEYGKAYAQVFLKEYLDLKKEQKGKSSNVALVALAGEIEKVSDKLTEANIKLQQFRKEHKDLMIEEYGDFSQKALMDIARQIADLKIKKGLIAKQVRALRANEDPSLWISIIDTMNRKEIVPVIGTQSSPSREDNNEESGNSQITKSKKKKTANANASPFFFVLEKDQGERWNYLRSQYQGIKSELARVAGVYKPQHPVRQQLESELEEVIRGMKSERVVLLKRFMMQYRALCFQEEALKMSKGNLEEGIVSSSSQMNGRKLLDEEVSRLQKLYDSLIKRMNEIEVSNDEVMQSILIIEEPKILPEPVAPRRLRDMLIAFMLSLICACGLVFILEYLDDSVKSTDDLKDNLGWSTLGIVPFINWNQEDYTTHRITNVDDFDVLESYRSIRTNILLSRPENELKTILITSSFPSEGKTSLSVNTSIVLAQGGMKVLLIDCDLRKPSVHKVLGLRRENGLSSILLQKKTFRECVQNTGIEGFDFLSGGDTISDPPRLLHSAQFKTFLQEMMKIYDKVIIDSAPVLTVTESVILSELVDGIIFVLYGGRTSRKILAKAKEAMLANSSKIIGAVINGLEKTTSGYYYYPYKYSYKYGYYKYRKPGADQDDDKKSKKKSEKVSVA